MEMESPVNFEMKVEPASPLWELELLDEVGGIWEGDVGVIDEVEDNVFWGQEDISELIGKEEQILGLELDEIVLEDDVELKEGSLESFYPPDDSIRIGTGLIGTKYSDTNCLTRINIAEALMERTTVCENMVTLPVESFADGISEVVAAVEVPESGSFIDALRQCSSFADGISEVVAAVEVPGSGSIIDALRQCSLVLEGISASEVSFNDAPFIVSAAADMAVDPVIESFANDTTGVSRVLDLKSCDDFTHKTSVCSSTLCTNVSCKESVCTDASCSETECTNVHCTGAVLANPYHSVVYANGEGLSNTVQPLLTLNSDCVFPILRSANELVSNPVEYSSFGTEPFSWLDSGAIYDGPNSTVSGLPTYHSSGLWSAPESPSEEKVAVFVPGGPAASADPMHSAPADLLKEFEDVLSQAAGSLTPPDSPRSANGNNVLLQLPSNHLQPLPMSPASSQGFIILQDMANSPAVNDDLDELMAETYQKNGVNVSDGGNMVKIIKASRPWDSPSASSSGCSDSGYEDPDWSPAKSTESSASTDTPLQTKKLRLTSTEERRLRKKEQNKNAATRYRMKKKVEMEEIIGEEKELLDRHDSLKSDVVEITREIKYLKGLMGDLFRAKGLIRAK